MTTFFLGRSYKYAFSADRETMIDQSMNTTKVQFGEPISFIGITYRNVGEGLLTGAEITQTNALPKHTP